jgi:hypothetical protein
MKQLKMLGALVVATAALAATFGATASATVLCKAAAEPCTSTYGLGTEIEMELVAGTEGSWTGWPDSCRRSRVSGKVSNAGGPGSTVTIQVTRFEWIECPSRSHATFKFPTLELHWVSATQATVTFKGFEWQDAFMCNYAVATAAGGTFTESATSTSDARMDMSLTAKTLTFGCPEQETWEATYTIVKPVPLFVSAS